MPEKTCANDWKRTNDQTLQLVAVSPVKIPYPNSPTRRSGRRPTRSASRIAKKATNDPAVIGTLASPSVPRLTWKACWSCGARRPRRYAVVTVEEGGGDEQEKKDAKVPLRSLLDRHWGITLVRAEVARTTRAQTRHGPG